MSPTVEHLLWKKETIFASPPVGMCLWGWHLKKFLSPYVVNRSNTDSFLIHKSKVPKHAIKQHTRTKTNQQSATYDKWVLVCELGLFRELDNLKEELCSFRENIVTHYTFGNVIKINVVTCSVTCKSLIDAPRCFAMLLDALWCFVMLFDAPWRSVMFRDVLRCSVMLHDVPWCSWCSVMLRDAP